MMNQQNYSLQEMKDLFEILKSFNKPDEQYGITRLAYSAEDEVAHQYISEMMISRGLVVREDAMGNIFARLPGKNRQLPAVGTGSHLDSVPHGGAYDGSLGVIAGFYALMQYKPGELLRDLELVVFRAEESSRFGFSCAGSKVLVGSTCTDLWKSNVDNQGKNIIQAMAENGYSVENMSSCHLPDDYFSAFVELHIEQGRCLEAAGLPIGVVNGIAAPTRFAVTVKGHADHSGATPMHQRQDALVASAMLVNDINHAACRESCWGTVGTVGKLDVSPNAMNVIPGEVNFYVDIRGIDIPSILRVVSLLEEAVRKAEIENNVQITLRKISSENPVKLDEGICEVITKECEKNNVRYMTMLSGAGHDTMNMARKYPSAMIFTPSREGISHHPDEYTDFSDIEIAANLLTGTLRELANRQ